MLRFEFVSVLAESNILFKTNSLQTVEVKGVNKLNNTITRHYMLFLFICQFMLLILSKDKTISHLGLSELLVILSSLTLT